MNNSIFSRTCRAGKDHSTDYRRHLPETINEILESMEMQGALPMWEMNPFIFPQV